MKKKRLTEAQKLERLVKRTEEMVAGDYRTNIKFLACLEKGLRPEDSVANTICSDCKRISINKNLTTKQRWENVNINMEKVYDLQNRISNVNFFSQEVRTEFSVGISTCIECNKRYHWLYIANGENNLQEVN